MGAGFLFVLFTTHPAPWRLVYFTITILVEYWLAHGGCRRMHTVSDTPLCSEMTVAQFLPPPDPRKETRGTSWGKRGEGGNLRDYTWRRHNLGCLYVSVTLKVRYWCTDQHNLLHTYTGYKDIQFKLQYMMQIQTWLLAHTRYGSILPPVKGSSDSECNHGDTSCEHVEESI